MLRSDSSTHFLNNTTDDDDPLNNSHLDLDNNNIHSSQQVISSHSLNAPPPPPPPSKSVLKKPPPSTLVSRISRPRNISQSFKSLFRTSASRLKNTFSDETLVSSNINNNNNNTNSNTNSTDSVDEVSTSPAAQPPISKRWSCADIHNMVSDPITCADNMVEESSLDTLNTSMDTLPDSTPKLFGPPTTTSLIKTMKPGPGPNKSSSKPKPPFSRTNRPTLVPLVVPHISSPLSSGPALMSPTHVAFLRNNLAQEASYQHSVPSNVGTSTELLAFSDKHDYHAQLYEISQQMANLGHSHHLNQQHQHATQVYANPSQARNVPLGVPTAVPPKHLFVQNQYQNRTTTIINPVGNQPARSVSQTPTPATQLNPPVKQVPIINARASMTTSTVAKPVPNTKLETSMKWNETSAAGGMVRQIDMQYTNKPVHQSIPTPIPPKSVAQNILEQCKLVPDFERQYVVGDELGSGGFGFVVTATRISDHLEVAVKFIFKDKVPVSSLVKDPVLGIIPMEVYILKNMQHPTIIGFFDYFVDNRFYYLVMELHGVPWKKSTVPIDHLATRSQTAQPSAPLLTAQRNATGHHQLTNHKPVIGKRQSMDLFECIEANSRLSEDIARKIFSQVASAVQYLDTFRIVHRDIKDENIVVDQHFTVKLIDFGSALMIPSNGRLFDRFAGTLQYCPPEVLQGHKYRGPEQEVWALGILLYTILFSGAPFANVSQVLYADVPIPRYTKGPSAGKPRASSEVVHLLRMMLNKSVIDRATIQQVCAHPWVTRIKPSAPTTITAESETQVIGGNDNSSSTPGSDLLMTSTTTINNKSMTVVMMKPKHPLQQVEVFPESSSSSPFGSPVQSPLVNNNNNNNVRGDPRGTGNSMNKSSLVRVDSVAASAAI